MSAVTEAVTAYGAAIRTETRLREARDAAKADAARYSAELAAAAEHRHSLRVTLDGALAAEDD